MFPATTKNTTASNTVKNKMFKYPVILDGATGTELIKKGYSGKGSSEQWTLEHPEAIIEIQRDYISAGSQIVYSPTFGANRAKMTLAGLQDRVEEYNRRLVELSKEAVSGKALVAGDMSPTGLFISNSVSFDELYNIYLEQASFLKQAGVDLFVIETMVSLDDAAAALKSVKAVCDLPVMVSVTCDENGRMLCGADVTAALVKMQGMGADIFGLNCSAGPAEMLSQIKRLSDFSRVPLLAKPNAGMPQMTDKGPVYDIDPLEFASYAPEMAEYGVKVFGGCCGTDARHIKTLNTAVSGITDFGEKTAEGIICATPREAVMFDVLPAAFPVDLHGNIRSQIKQAQSDSIKLLEFELSDTDDVESFLKASRRLNVPVKITGKTELVLRARDEYPGFPIE